MSRLNDISAIEEILKKKSSKKEPYRCPNCNSKISMSKAFCNRTCKDDHFEYLKIDISPKFVKNIIQNTHDNEKKCELIQGCVKFHNFELRMFKKRFTEIAKEQFDTPDLEFFKKL